MTFLFVSNFYNILCITTLQRQNTEFSKQRFPEKEYRDLCPNFHIHASVSDLYISTIGLPIQLEEICSPILGLQYINCSQTHECWNWGWGRAIPRKGIHKWDFRNSAYVSKLVKTKVIHIYFFSLIFVILLFFVCCTVYCIWP